MVRVRQRSICCPCGRSHVFALGLCETCYRLTRKDRSYFGGNREAVLKRDGYRCCVPGCTTLKRGKRSVAVHHRSPGNSDPSCMVTLCLACHAKVTRTKFLRRQWPELLRVLWREQHPRSHEQTPFDFAEKKSVARAMSLFPKISAE